MVLVVPVVSDSSDLIHTCGTQFTWPTTGLLSTALLVCSCFFFFLEDLGQHFWKSKSAAKSLLG